MDLERLAEATYLIGRYADSMELSRRAFRDAVRAGDVGSALRSAFWVAVEHLGRGEMASDRELVAKMKADVRGGEGGLAELVIDIVCSPQFRQRRASGAVDAE